ncbi:hypothetical protein AZE42_10666 [Rhizopogon vesiculosus]|uniref:F-box domain-containing protein n=1 Tax=Rhizopogon vesiculosus TaxID=180088 RepID=A0A1J8PZV6_9AGAM|nr:hypothetical protein AZE42_10666 [Rhizopogon vesiculosus]
MQHSELPSLKELKIIIDVLPWTKAEQQLFHALPLCKACETLESIDIFSYPPGQEEIHDKPLTAVRQFLCFLKLRTLRLSLAAHSASRARGPTLPM